MADTITKQRTFFHYRGANAKFCEEDIDWSRIHADILHIGYILLLDALDAPDTAYGTKMAKLLHAAQEQESERPSTWSARRATGFERYVRPR
jgi:sugar/nucleoside kinase (ribokinase family)